MAIKKSELYSSLWSSYDELRGGMGQLVRSGVPDSARSLGLAYELT